MKTRFIVVIIMALVLGSLLEVVSQTVAERKPRPVPPPCCRPFKTEDVTSPDISAGSTIFNFPTMVIGDTRSPIGEPVGGAPKSVPTPTPALEPEEIAIYGLNLEQYRLTTELQKRKGLITETEYNRRIAWYKLRWEEFKGLN